MCPAEHVNCTTFIMMMLSNACKNKYKGTLGYCQKQHEGLILIVYNWNNSWVTLI